MVAFSLNAYSRYQSKMSDAMEQSVKQAETVLDATFEALIPSNSEEDLMMIFYDYKSIKKIDNKRRIWSYSMSSSGDVIKGRISNLSHLYFEFDCIDSRKLLSTVIHEGYSKDKVIIALDTADIQKDEKSIIIPDSLEEYIQKKICR